MNYQNLSDLPAEIREQMPEQAQELYIAAHNRAVEKAHASGEVVSQDDLQKTAHEAALRKVEAEYELDEQGRWHRRPIGEEIDETKLQDE